VTVAVAIGCSGGSSSTPTSPSVERPALALASHAPASSASTPTPSPPLELFDGPSRSGDWAPRGTPEEAGADRASLEKLVAACQTTDTHALIVIANGHTVVERQFGHDPTPTELMSVTKGVVGLAIGKLVTEGKIRSVDEPLSAFFPEWKKGDKAKVTLRHVLTHTSGLAHKPAAGELTKQKDRLAYVRALPIESPPGKTFSYNNEATQLLAGVVKAASGRPLDEYVSAEILDPLGITRRSWARDATGTPAASWGLSIEAADLAKIGAMLLARGKWGDRRILAESWIDDMAKPVRDDVNWHGLLAWLRYDGPYRVQTPERRKVYADLGFTASADLAPLDGRRFETFAAYWLEAGALLDAAERASFASLVRDDRLPVELTKATYAGFDFNGWLGQYLVVLPSRGIVAVRQRPEPPGGGDDADNKKNGLHDFVRLVMASAKPAASD
jgi:CubicO group peptidase (beta-lactamase class C family)